MTYRLGISCLVVLCMCSVASVRERIQTRANSRQLPPIETFLLEPAELENAVLWVPAAKSGPDINNGCELRKNYSYSAILPAGVAHTKTPSCPRGVAKLLAQETASYHRGTLPLTILDGWQWEYSYNSCQFESVSYDLPAYGGSWEGAWEAILTHSQGSIDFQWAQIPSSSNANHEQTASVHGSDVEVTTFSAMRTRDGYPKRRQFDKR